MDSGRGRVPAYSSAQGLLAVGFVFTGFSLEVAGVDLLLDAVGWLLVFNGVRPLEKPEGGLGPRAGLCLGLVAVSALQLFFAAGAVYNTVTAARAVLEILLFILLAGLFKKVFPPFGLHGSLLASAAILGVNALVSALLGLFLLLPAGAFLGAVQVFAYFARGALVLMPLGLLFLLQRAAEK